MSQSPTAGEAPLVLNVDDDDTARYVKTRILRQAGFGVVEAADGAAALLLALERQPQVVVLDVRLPDISGIEVCRRLKSSAATAHQLILQTSAALVSAGDRVRGLQGGADHYLAQPFDADELIASVQALLRIQRAEASMRRSAEQAHATAREIAARNLRLALLADVTADLLWATDMETMLGRLFERIAPALQLDAYAHCAVEPGGLVLVSQSGLADDVQAAIRGWSGGPAGSSTSDRGFAGEHGSGSSLSREMEQACRAQCDIVTAHGWSACFCTPLFAVEQATGTLAFARREHPFSEGELQFLRTLCGSVAVARARLAADRLLLEHARRLREAAAQKDQFLAVLSHELRNPLAPIVSAVAFLDRNEALSQDGRRALQIVHRQARQMKRLVDDLLDVSRITRGVIQLQPERLSLMRLIDETVEGLLPVLQARHQSLHVERPDEPVELFADPARFAQILENLLTNASKFTGEGGWIRVEVQPEGPDVALRIVDNGIGIRSDKLDSVFELFVQAAPDDEALPAGGLGIGLAVVRRLTEMHGGSVSAESAGLGTGARFTVRLPRLLPEQR